MTPRSEVYAAIDSERDYQQREWGTVDESEDNFLTVGEQLLLLEEYVAKARLVWSKEKKPEYMTLHVIRKIAGIAVNAMEHHGAPMRPDEIKP